MTAEWFRIYLRCLLRYLVIPCGIGLGVFAAIILTGDTVNVTVPRFATACTALILIPAVIDLPQIWWQLRRQADGE